MTNISQWSCPTEIEIENTENSKIRNENDKLSDDSNFLRCQNFEKISNDQQYGKFEKNDQLNYQDKDKIYFKTNSTKSNIDMNSGIHSRHYNKNDEYHHDNNDNKNNRNDNDNNYIVTPTYYNHHLSKIEKNDELNNVCITNIYDNISLNNESSFSKNKKIPLGKNNSEKDSNELNAVYDYYNKNNKNNLIEGEPNCISSSSYRKASSSAFSSSSSSTTLCRRKSSRNVDVILVLNDDDLGI